MAIIDEEPGGLFPEDCLQPQYLGLYPVPKALLPDGIALVKMLHRARK
jgi:hypothetical protein